MSDPKLAATQGFATRDASCCIRRWTGDFVDSFLAKAPLIFCLLREARMVAGLKENPNFRFALHRMGWIILDA